MIQDRHQRKKIGVARLSVVSNTLLVLLKIIVGILTGSVSIISEAIHSGMDLIAAVIAFFSVRISSNPPDKTHPYGHGKYENVSGVIEALLIFVAAGWIIYEAVHKILNPCEISSLGIGSLVMLVSAAVNFFVSRRLYRVAKLTDSVALEADALHLKTDVYTSLGVAAGLILIYFTDVSILDPLIAILVALIILRESFILLKKAFTPLVDVTLPAGEIKIIEQCIQRHLSGPMKFHKLRTRKAGHFRYVDLHLEVPGNYSVADSHKLCDDIEHEITLSIKNVEVNIHIEPLP